MATHHRSADIATVTISIPHELLGAVDQRTRALHFLSRSSYVCSVLRAQLIRQADLVISPSDQPPPPRPRRAPNGKR
jgi:hypothetical protein